MLFLQRKNFEKLCSTIHLNSNCLACFYVPFWNSYKFGNFYARAMISTFLELAWTYQSYGMISKYTLSGNYLSKIGLFEVHCIFQVKKKQKNSLFTKTSLFFLDFREMFHFFIFDLSDIWVNRIQKLGGCVFFSINFGSLKGWVLLSDPCSTSKPPRLDDSSWIFFL